MKATDTGLTRPWNRIAAPVVIALLASLVAGCGGTDTGDESAAGETPEQLTVVAPFESLHYLPLRIADEKGFFTDENLEIDLSTISGPASGHVSAVIAGEAWAFVGGLEHIVVANAQGGDLRAVLSFAGRVPSLLVAPGDFELGSDPAAALAGKRIGVAEVGRTPHFLARAYLESIGLDPDHDVTLMEAPEGARLAALANGQMDLAVVTDIPAVQGMADGRWDDIVYDLSDFGLHLQPVLGLKASTIADDPETVERFVRALVRAQRWIYDEHDAALEFALGTYPDVEPSVLEEVFSRALERELWAPDGRPLPGAFQAVEDLTRSLTDAEVDVAAAFDDRFLPDDGG